MFSRIPASLRWFFLAVFALVGTLLAALALGGIFVILAYPQLPSLEALTDYQPKIPLRIYSSDGFLIGEFGEERRRIVKVQDLPAHLKQAILAAEDERFYRHAGVDTLGILRAGLHPRRASP